MVGLLCSSYNVERKSWCVFKKESETTMSFLWRCHNREAAEKLASDVNNGAQICKGCKQLGTDCGECVKCDLAA